jgi:phytoene dehydrogenase-like protein
METNTNIVIVGAGLAGLTAAIHLSKLGYSITIIEKNRLVLLASQKQSVKSKYHRFQFATKYLRADSASLLRGRYTSATLPR